MITGGTIIFLTDFSSFVVHESIKEKRKIRLNSFFKKRILKVIFQLTPKVQIKCSNFLMNFTKLSERFRSDLEKEFN